jgi:hypothetical protein
MKATGLRCRRFLYVCALIIVFVNVSAQQAAPKECVVKFLETGIKYSQLNGGYLQGYFSLWRETGLGYMPAFRESEIAIGYSPWRNAVNIEASYRLVLMVISFGGGAGYCTQTDFSRGQFFIKPEVGLNLSIFQVYYTYSFATPNYDLYRTESNLTIAVPIGSTTHFGSCQKTKRWRMGGVIHAIFQGERWQIWE